MREESAERHEAPGSGFSEVALLDTVVSHKKRDGFALKVCVAIQTSWLDGEVRGVRQTHSQSTSPLHHVRDGLPPRVSTPELHPNLGPFRHVRMKLLFYP